MKLFLALMLCIAPAFAQTFSITVIDRYENVSALKSGCISGAIIKGERASIGDRAERGSYFYVEGMHDRRFNGLYRITEFHKKREPSGDGYKVTFTAECIKK